MHKITSVDNRKELN